MKNTTRTARTTAAQTTPQLAQAALQATPRKAAPASWYASPRSLAEARPLAQPEPGSAAWLADQREGREAREAREVAEGSWAQPGTLVDLALVGYPGTVGRVTRRYTERAPQGGWLQLATVEEATGGDFGDWAELDVDVRDLEPTAPANGARCADAPEEGGHPDAACGWCGRCLACEGGSWADHQHAACAS